MSVYLFLCKSMSIFIHLYLFIYINFSSILIYILFIPFPFFFLLILSHSISNVAMSVGCYGWFIGFVAISCHCCFFSLRKKFLYLCLFLRQATMEEGKQKNEKFVPKLFLFYFLYICWMKIERIFWHLC